MVDPHQKKLVLNALQSSNYKWRSVQGISKETGLSENIVQQVIDERRDRILRAHCRKRKGRVYYTTREHFLKTASIKERILGAIRNRIR